MTNHNGKKHKRERYNRKARRERKEKIKSLD
jgi:hypothetical protein